MTYPSCLDDCHSGDLPCPHPEECQDGLGWYHAIVSAILVALVCTAPGVLVLAVWALGVWLWGMMS